MKNININKKIFSIINSTFILMTLSGCSNNKENELSSSGTIFKEPTYSNSGYIEYNYDNYIDNLIIDKPETATSIKSNTIDTNKHIEETTTITSIIQSENIELDYFEDAKYDIGELLDNDQLEKAKLKAKETIKVGIDFIFYDKAIDGITFNQLKEESKKLTYESINTIDNWIIEIFPNYKEEIGDKYQIASGFISDKYYKIKDDIKEYLGQENYNALIDIKERVGNSIIEGYEKTKEKTKNWYNNNF